MHVRMVEVRTLGPWSAGCGGVEVEFGGLGAFHGFAPPPPMLIWHRWNSSKGEETGRFSA